MLWNVSPTSWLWRAGFSFGEPRGAAEKGETGWNWHRKFHCCSWKQFLTPTHFLIYTVYVNFVWHLPLSLNQSQPVVSSSGPAGPPISEHLSAEEGERKSSKRHDILKSHHPFCKFSYNQWCWKCEFISLCNPKKTRWGTKNKRDRGVHFSSHYLGSPFPHFLVNNMGRGRVAQASRRFCLRAHTSMAGSLHTGRQTGWYCYSFPLCWKVLRNLACINPN